MIYLENLAVWAHENWGSLASAFGALLTIIFAWQAKTAAVAAKLAAEGMKLKLAKIDIFSELGKADSAFEQISGSIGAESWEIARQKSAEMRVRLHVIVREGSDILSDETLNALGEASEQLRIVSERAAKAAFKNARTVSKPRILDILLEQRKVVASAFSEIKERLGEEHNG